MKEIWKPLRESNNEIEISNLGRVKRVFPLARKPESYCYAITLGGSGTAQSYITTSAGRRMITVAREVLITFENATRPQKIKYKDGDPLNCRIDNLEYTEKGEYVPTERDVSFPPKDKYPQRDCTQCTFYPCILDRNNQKFNHKTHFAKSGCVNYKKL